MFPAGGEGQKLNAPGKFLISAPEHGTPRRARAYPLADEMVAAIAAEHAATRRALDAVSQAALGQRAQRRPDEPASSALPDHADDDGRWPDDDRGAPEAILRAVLCVAPPEGTTVPELMDQTGMSRPWVYQRLSGMARRGHVIQVSRGRWRASGDAR